MTAAMHRHDISYRYPISAHNGIEYGTCACGIPLTNQHTESRKGIAIPRDIDTAHAEALAESRIIDRYAIAAAHHQALIEKAYRECRVYGMGKRK